MPDTLLFIAVVVTIGALVVWQTYRDGTRMTCEYCGSADICQQCRRCHDEGCNAGCISCRRAIRFGPVTWHRH